MQTPDYQLESRIKSLIETSGYSVKKIADTIGKSEGGFYQMLKNKSMKVSTLLDLARVLQVRPTVFFEGFDVGDHNDPAQAQIIRAKDEIIGLLKQRIVDLEDRLSKCEEVPTQKRVS